MNLTQAAQIPQIKTIKAAGYRVFIRPSGNVTYCFYTDGTRIAYAQWDAFRESVSTVHIPSRQVGAGYGIADRITPETLEKAFCIAPHWANSVDVRQVHKYRDMDHYLSASKWNAELIEV